MILLFDIGNTNIVIGLVEKDHILATYRVITDSSLSEDEYYQKINNVILHSNIYSEITGAAVSSVVPQLDHTIIAMLEKYYKITPLLVAPKLKSGLAIKIENPKQLGADLLCAAVGAFEKYGGPTIVVDLGTATKLMVVTNNKEFIGGAICPGIVGSLNSLVASTAKLSKIALVKPNRVIGNDTISCMQSGLIYGHASMIDGLISQMQNEINLSEVKVIITGGLSSLVRDILKTPTIYEPNIVLEGLLTIYNKNI